MDDDDDEDSWLYMPWMLTFVYEWRCDDDEDGLVYALVPVVRALGRMRIRDEFAVWIGSCISCVC